MSPKPKGFEKKNYMQIITTQHCNKILNYCWFSVYVDILYININIAIICKRFQLQILEIHVCLSDDINIRVWVSMMPNNF